MKEGLFELILNPIRMRIVQALLNDQELTAQELIELLPEVPQATLYRHLKKLTDAGVLEIVSENKVRGTVEKVYKLVQEKVSLSPDELKQLTQDDHMRYFTTFLTSLMGELKDYLQGSPDPVKDGLSYRQVKLYLSDEEFTNLFKVIASEIKKNMLNKPSPERRLRTIANIVIPEQKSGER